MKIRFSQIYLGVSLFFSGVSLVRFFSFLKTCLPREEYSIVDGSEYFGKWFIVSLINIIIGVVALVIWFKKYKNSEENLISNVLDSAKNKNGIDAFCYIISSILGLFALVVLVGILALAFGGESIASSKKKNISNSSGNSSTASLTHSNSTQSSNNNSVSSGSTNANGNAPCKTEEQTIQDIWRKNPGATEEEILGKINRTNVDIEKVRACKPASFSFEEAHKVRYMNTVLQENDYERIQKFTRQYPGKSDEEIAHKIKQEYGSSYGPEHIRACRPELSFDEVVNAKRSSDNDLFLFDQSEFKKIKNIANANPGASDEVILELSRKATGHPKLNMETVRASRRITKY